MAHTKSAKKRAKTSAKKQVANRAAKSLIKTIRKKLLDAVAAKTADASQAALRAYCSALDKSAKRGIITKNNAIRKKARAVKLVRSLSSK